ncbi:MAG: hypothetical protein O6834_09250, partial [Actinobacteria bacterium]|nr:hypothetical protein [Actinomycetota bacterium]
LSLYRRMKTSVTPPYRIFTEQPHWTPDDMLPEVGGESASFISRSLSNRSSSNQFELIQSSSNP